MLLLSNLTATSNRCILTVEPLALVTAYSERPSVAVWNYVNIAHRPPPRRRLKRRGRDGSRSAAPSIPLAASKASERDQSDEHDDQPAQETPDEHQNESDDHDDAAKRDPGHGLLLYR